MTKRSAEFLPFIWPVVQWIIRQWSFAPILSPWNARFSLLVVLSKYSYALGQQPNRRVPSYFRHILHASPLRIRENLSERGLTVKCEVFTTTSTFEIQLCARPATQPTCSLLLPADFTRRSIAHARKSKWKGSIRARWLREEMFMQRSRACLMADSKYLSGQDEWGLVRIQPRMLRPGPATSSLWEMGRGVGGWGGGWLSFVQFKKKRVIFQHTRELIIVWKT